jgi:adenosylhomocysteine nucleosidase
MKKNYLVVTAMEEEQTAFLSLYKGFIKEEDFYVVENADSTIYCMLGGIGKVSMSFMLGKFLSTHKIDEVFNIGVAGSISPRLKPFMTLIADKCAYHDVDVTAFGYQYGQMCQCPLYFKCDSESVRIAMEDSDPALMTGLILSGDSFMTTKNMDTESFGKFSEPLAVDMESTAVAQCCHIADVPFLIIRSISDDAASNEENKDQYENNLNKAARKAAEIVKLVIEKK